jgi:hypothetical protein
MHWKYKPFANRKNLIKKNNFNPKLQRNNSFDSIIKIQNFLHLPLFSQQPQNHLKKQENWYITRRKSALGLLSELCFRVEREGIYWLKEMVKGFSFSSLYVEEEKIGWRFSLLFEGKGGVRRWKRPIHSPDPTLFPWEESFNSLFSPSCEWWQQRRVPLLWDIFYWYFFCFFYLLLSLIIQRLFFFKEKRCFW